MHVLSGVSELIPETYFIYELILYCCTSVDCTTVKCSTVTHKVTQRASRFYVNKDTNELIESYVN